MTPDEVRDAAGQVIMKALEEGFAADQNYDMIQQMRENRIQDREMEMFRGCR